MSWKKIFTVIGKLKNKNSFYIIIKNEFIL